MKKQTLLLAALVAVWALPARANLPAGSVTKLVMPIYALYTTSDPLCMTGLVPTIPFRKTAEDFDFGAGTSLGKGKIPKDGINCVIAIGRMKLTFSVAKGTYTGTTYFGINGYPDSGCNSGLVDSKQDMSNGNGPTCQPGKWPTAITWPQQIKDDAAALGITLPTDCNSTGAGEYAPFFMSTYSKCYGATELDNAIGGGCKWSLNTNITSEGYRSNQISRAPTFDGDPSNGLKLAPLPPGVKKYKFIADLTVAIGGNDGGCNMFGPPKFGFEPVKSK